MTALTTVSGATTPFAPMSRSCFASDAVSVIRAVSQLTRITKGLLRPINSRSSLSKLLGARIVPSGMRIERPSLWATMITVLGNLARAA